MDWVYGNGGVRDEESRQDRQGVLFRLAGLFSYPEVCFTENPGNLRDNNRRFFLSLLFLPVGSCGKAMELRRMSLTTQKTSVV